MSGKPRRSVSVDLCGRLHESRIGRCARRWLLAKERRAGLLQSRPAVNEFAYASNLSINKNTYKIYIKGRVGPFQWICFVEHLLMASSRALFSARGPGVSLESNREPVPNGAANPVKLGRITSRRVRSFQDGSRNRQARLTCSGLLTGTLHGCNRLDLLTEARADGKDHDRDRQ